MATDKGCNKIEASRAAREARIARGEKAYRTPLERLAETPLSLRAAINAKCYDCQGQDFDPGVRERIKTCECPDCPLYAVRPYQQRHKD